METSHCPPSYRQLCSEIKGQASIVDGTVAVYQSFSSFNRAGLEQRFPQAHQAHQPEEEPSRDSARGKAARATKTREFPAPQPPTCSREAPCSGLSEQRPGSLGLSASSLHSRQIFTFPQKQGEWIYKKTYKVLELLSVRPSLLAVTRLEQSNDCWVSSQGKI